MEININQNRGGSKSKVPPEVKKDFKKLLVKLAQEMKSNEEVMQILIDRDMDYISIEALRIRMLSIRKKLAINTLYIDTKRTVLPEYMRQELYALIEEMLLYGFMRRDIFAQLKKFDMYWLSKSGIDTAIKKLRVKHGIEVLERDMSVTEECVRLFKSGMKIADIQRKMKLPSYKHAWFRLRGRGLVGGNSYK